MKRILPVALVAVAGLALASPSYAWRLFASGGGPRQHVTVVVREGFPIRRRLPLVVVHPRPAFVVVAPTSYLPPVYWTERVAVMPASERLAWESSEALDRQDGWSEFTLPVNDRGERLFLEVRGRVQISFAEVVFGNGETQVVDFGESTRHSGVYSLLDFADGRHVSHVRFVARAKSEDARIVVRMEK
jgi:hypothetical protein